MRGIIRSRYNNVVVAADAALLVHGHTGAMDVVGLRLAEWLSGDASLSQLEESLPPRLLARGYLWDTDRGDEREYFSALSESIHRRNVEARANSFWVIPTYRCNLRCSYCFQEHELHEGRGFGEVEMTPQEARGLIEALEELGGAGPQARCGRGRYITLFGGEPLMEPMLPTVRAVLEEARQRGYRVGAVTNGVDLRAFEELLGPDKIRWLQITLDGFDATHDRRRLSQAGSQFDKVVKGITLALKAGAQVSLRTNADARVAAAVGELEKWADRLGWSGNPNFTWYMTPIETHYNSSLERMTVPVEELMKIVVDRGHGRIRVPYRRKFLRLFRALASDGIGDCVETSSCGAHTKMYFFDPHGLIYACAEQVGHPELAIGAVSSGKANLEKGKAQVWLTRHVGNMPVCSGCANAFFCGGGCANAASIETGDFFGPRCNGIKSAFQTTGKEFLDEVLSEIGATGCVLDDVGMFELAPGSLIRTSRSAFLDLVR